MASEGALVESALVTPAADIALQLQIEQRLRARALDQLAQEGKARFDGDRTVITSLRDLPPHERAIWKDVFDHYVFGYDEAVDAGHIPESARRVLASLDEDRVRHLRARRVPPPER